MKRKKEKGRGRSVGESSLSLKKAKLCVHVRMKRKGERRFSRRSRGRNQEDCDNVGVPAGNRSISGSERKGDVQFGRRKEGVSSGSKSLKEEKPTSPQNKKAFAELFKKGECNFGVQWFSREGRRVRGIR